MRFRHGRAPGGGAVGRGGRSRPLAWTLAAELDRPDSLVVDYWTEGAPRLRVRSPRAAEHSLLLARLRAGRSYRWRIAGSEREGAFATAPLPAAPLPRPLPAKGGVHNLP